MKFKHKLILLLASKRLLDSWKIEIFKFVNSKVVSIEYRSCHDDFKVDEKMIEAKIQERLICIDDESRLEQNLIIITTTFILYDNYVEKLSRARASKIKWMNEDDKI